MMENDKKFSKSFFNKQVEFIFESFEHDLELFLLFLERYKPLTKAWGIPITKVIKLST